MKICMTLVLSISFANVICAQSLEEKSSAALFRDVFDFLKQKHDLGELNDLEDDEIRDGVLQLFRKHEFDESDLMADGFLSGIWNMLGSRNGKSTFQFYNLARQLGCYQGKSRGLIRTIRFAYTNYNEYGCYCGGGKSYGNPLDDTDRCCQIHDVCYEKAMKKYKLSEGCQTYTTQYKTKCYMRRKTTECGNESPSAGRALCDCDQAMAICVSRPKALKTYRTSLKNVRRSAKCYVPGKTTSTSKNIWKLIKTCKNIGRKRSARRRRRRGFLWGK